MSGISKLMYTLAKYDPRVVSDPALKLLDVQEHNDLVAMLSESGVAKYNNLLLSMIRYIDYYSQASDEKRIAIKRELVNAFNGDDYFTVDEKDSLYFIERIILGGGEVHPDPINVWSINTKITKAVILRKMFHTEFDYKDMDCIRHMLNINKEIYFGVKLGGADATDKIQMVNTINKYLYEFYKRSADPSEELLEYYFRRSTSKNMSMAYYKQFEVEPFRYDLTLATSIEQSICNIDEFCDNLKHYTRRLYEISYYEDYCEATSGGGNKHYSVKFSKWDRCIRVFDLYKEYLDKGKPVNTPQIDAIGKKVVKEFKLSSKYDDTDLRKIIKQDHATALDLIERSKEGHLS